MARPTISEGELTAALEQVSPPRGHSWQYDQAASGDRLRLFVDDGPHVGAAYADGRWFVEDPDPKTYEASAGGTATELVPAMRKVILVAEALGWFDRQPNKKGNRR